MPHINTPMLGLTLVALFGSLVGVFWLAHKVFNVLIFLLTFLAGAGVGWVFGFATGHPQPLWMLGGEGLAFAWVLNLIRKKVARMITAALVLAGSQVVGYVHHLQSSNSAKIGQKAHLKSENHSPHVSRRSRKE